MAKTALDLSPDEWKQYRLPERPITPEIEARWYRAWQLIPELVRRLREDFGAQQIKVFGSAINAAYFSAESDIDLAVWGIPSARYFAAALAVDEFNPEFKVDLIDPTRCHIKLRERINNEGIDV
ncbi:hypothetical protein XM38_045790 [Halomicronema hongdechloris C2206]|uniref:Polymerase beta nucleotidyltransferase domain-containing protein n=1 Tax=Halomicronema hongdechloris C2206 TaxID=1641165 RepID=A0A1Z3HTG5_9CYAN|nr:nucleotidyltransferase [Halomicronema hongdechloris]ASC73608.1 hypothetical protein XM38_045790 [Halomicronema hongdechloris C2206]